MIWTTLLHLRAQLQDDPSHNMVRVIDTRSIELSNSEQTSEFSPPGLSAGLNIRFDKIGEQAKPLSVSATEAFSVEISADHALLEKEYRELELYLPYALLPWFAHREQRTFAISHFAQTLDGRIASSSGDSKWIGNQENLTHAHKMRALCDAILVGTSTLRADQPRLSVRHVTGANPIRIILGDNFSAGDIASDNTGPVLIINKQKLLSSPLDQLTLSASSGKIKCQDILKELYARDINSIYIEGGATTTSHFLKSFSLDQVQIHVSPCILGSGITGFEFGGVNTMEQAIDFNNPRFLPVGDQIMFIGEVLHGDR